MKSPGRPDLTCKFCLPTLINSYATISGLWTHLVVKHPADDTMERLEEIKRTGSLWQAYWEVQSDGGKRGTNTPARLTQTQQSGFCWNDVLSWGLGS